jgi:hypothetical protein
MMTDDIPDARVVTDEVHVERTRFTFAMPVG